MTSGNFERVLTSPSETATSQAIPLTPLARLAVLVLKTHNEKLKFLFLE
jgi:hypothetical protein